MSPQHRAKAPAVDLAELRLIADLQKELIYLFPSRGSIDWELRANRAKYVRGGALFEISGRLMAHPKTFKKIALDLASRRVGK